MGSSSIKVAELARGEKGLELGTYGYAKFKVGDIKKDSALEQERSAAILKEICKQAKTKSINAIASLPPFFVFSSIICIPKMQDKDMESAVKWEAKKVIPLPLEQIELKWKVVNMKENAGGEMQKINNKEENKKDEKNEESKNRDKKEEEKKDENSAESGKKMQLLLTGAAKKIVQRYMAIFKKAGLNLYSLETESFALSRSLLNKDDKTVAMIVDIGALNTNIAIIKSGIPFLNRSVDVGSFTITKSIANSMNIGLERADQFQYDIGVALDDKSGTDGVPRLIEEAISAIINEIKYSFNLYEEYKNSILDPKDKIEKIVLCGGGAMIPNLSLYLENLLFIKTYIGTPWDKVAHNPDLNLILEEIGPNFPVAVGLAMRDL